MTKIPEGRGALAGLAPRQFSRKGIGPGKVDESWMESPLEKGKKKVQSDFENLLNYQVDDREYLKEEMEAAKQREMEKMFKEQKVFRNLYLIDNIIKAKPRTFTTRNASTKEKTIRGRLI